MNIAPAAAVKMSETLVRNPRAGEIFGVIIVAAGIGLIVFGSGVIIIATGAANRLANSFVTAFYKALGIKSPSLAMKEQGYWVCHKIV